jgi:hypothetical protein
LTIHSPDQLPLLPFLPMLLETGSAAAYLEISGRCLSAGQSLTDTVRKVFGLAACDGRDSADRLFLEFDGHCDGRIMGLRGLRGWNGGQEGFSGQTDEQWINMLMIRSKVEWENDGGEETGGGKFRCLFMKFGGPEGGWAGPGGRGSAEAKYSHFQL